ESIQTAPAAIRRFQVLRAGRQTRTANTITEAHCDRTVVGHVGGENTLARLAPEKSRDFVPEQIVYANLQRRLHAAWRRRARIRERRRLFQLEVLVRRRAAPATHDFRNRFAMRCTRDIRIKRKTLFWFAS